MRLGKTLGCMTGTASLLMATAAHACPFCDTYTGRQVREGIWNEHFWSNVLLTTLPFPIFAAIITLLYFGVPSMGRTKRLPSAGSTRKLMAISPPTQNPRFKNHHRL